VVSLPKEEASAGRGAKVHGTTSRAIALDMREALSGKLFDGGVQRVHDGSLQSSATMISAAAASRHAKSL
jgi:hypothetical protein